MVRLSRGFVSRIPSRTDDTGYGVVDRSLKVVFIMALEKGFVLMSCGDWNLL